LKLLQFRVEIFSVVEELPSIGESDSLGEESKDEKESQEKKIGCRLRS